MGNVVGAGAGQAPARQAAIFAGKEFFVSIVSIAALYQHILYDTRCVFFTHEIGLCCRLL